MKFKINPSTTVASKPANKGFKFKPASPEEKPAEKIGRKGDLLFGSGIRKSAIQSAEKKQAKLVTKGLTSAAPNKISFGKPARQEETKPETDNSTNLKTVDFGTREIDESQLDTDQLKALEGLSSQQFGCLIGYAGTGKTTTVKALVRRLQAQVGNMWTDDALPASQRGKGKNTQAVALAFASFTGRAVEQIKKALPKEYHSQCSTVHSLLGYAPTMEIREDEEGMPKEVKVFRPTFNSANKLPHKVVVIDEAGMLPIPLFNELVDAVTPDCRIYLMGDISQLPPVQGRSVLGFAMLEWPTYELTQVHRTALDNPVIANAHRILAGKHPVQDPNAFLMMELEASGMKASTQVEAAVKKIHKAGHFNEHTDALLVPQNTDMLGQENLNSKLLMYFNPPRKDENGITLNPRVKIQSGNGWALLAVGDKIMNTQNDRAKGLTNGMTGVITDIQLNDRFRSLAAYTDATNFTMEDFSLDAEAIVASHSSGLAEDKEAGELQASHVTTVQWENGSVTTLNSRGQYNNLLHAYACTGHKSQGGEYDTVIIVVHSANSAMLCREWLYTTVTRAKKRVILLSNYRGLSQAVKRQRIKGNTLKEKAEAFLKWSQTSDEDKLPNLPKPKEYTQYG